MIGTHGIQLICVDQSFEPNLQLFLPLESFLLRHLQCLKILSHHLIINIYISSHHLIYISVLFQCTLRPKIKTLENLELLLEIFDLLLGTLGSLVAPLGVRLHGGHRHWHHHFHHHHHDHRHEHHHRRCQGYLISYHHSHRHHQEIVLMIQKVCLPPVWPVSLQCPRIYFQNRQGSPRTLLLKVPPKVTWRKKLKIIQPLTQRAVCPGCRWTPRLKRLHSPAPFFSSPRQVTRC